jgi:glycosyltransferase involved in cell wall biosynthesis
MGTCVYRGRKVAIISIDVSIVIPLYNKASYIKRVLECIEGQEFANWECIIVDDGSTDESGKIAMDFVSSRKEKWRYIRQTNRGQAAARNSGIELSQGKYVAFLDADDFWPSSKLKSQFALLEIDPELVAVLSPFVIFSANSKTPRLVSHHATDKLISGWVTMRGFGGGIESVGLIRRSVLGTELRFDESLSTSSGLDFTLRLSSRGKIGFVKEIGLLYQLSEGQWHSNTHELIRNMKIIRRKYPNYTPESIDEWHSAYIYWTKEKSQGWYKIAVALVKSCSNSKRRWRLLMLWALTTRNIKAMWLGFFHRQEIRKLLPKKDQVS